MREDRGERARKGSNGNGSAARSGGLGICAGHVGAGKPGHVGVGCSDWGFDVPTVVAQPGDTITLVGRPDASDTCTLSLNGVATASSNTFNGAQTLVLTVIGTGTIDVATTIAGTVNPTLTIVAPMQNVPADILQQVPVPPAGSCAAVVDTAFSYGTSVSGGWGLTWAQWINHGAGGPVCSRTLHYEQAQGRWTVA